MDLGETPGYRMAIAAQYDERYRGHSVEAARARREALEPFLARVMDALALPEDGWHLDLGCGDGLCALEVARRRPAMSVVGLDHAPRPLEIARASAAAESLRNVSFVEGDAESPPAARDHRFSALSLLNLLPRKEAALRAWARLAAPHARLVLADGFATTHGVVEGVGPLGMARLVALGRRAGWRVVHREDVSALVAKLAAARAWPWPEYLRAGIRYEIVALERA